MNSIGFITFVNRELRRFLSLYNQTIIPGLLTTILYIVVFGKSLGGGVASEIAQGRKVMGLILESTFRSVPSVARNLIPMIPEEVEFESEQYDTASKIASIHVPVLIVHGTRDDLIPIREGQALFELAN